MVSRDRWKVFFGLLYCEYKVVEWVEVKGFSGEWVKKGYFFRRMYGWLNNMKVRVVIKKGKIK